MMPYLMEFSLLLIITLLAGAAGVLFGCILFELLNAWRDRK